MVPSQKLRALKYANDKFPATSEIGKTGDSKNAYHVGKPLEKKFMNWDLIWILHQSQMCTNAENTEIGNRSFGSEPKTADMVSQEVERITGTGVSATLKHFRDRDSAEKIHIGICRTECNH